MRSSTVADNTQTGVGGTSATVQIYGSTIATNGAQEHTGVHGRPSTQLFLNDATVTLGADLVVGSTERKACSSLPATAPVSVTSLGYNVVTDSTCRLTTTATSAQTVSTSAIGLQPLATNGGPTPTMSIPLTSAANHRVPATVAFQTTLTFCSTNDQRGQGYPRLDHGANTCAAGAFQPAPTLTVTTTLLPGDDVGVPYSDLLVASGGAGNEIWIIRSGSLPPGMTLSPTGELSGTPTAPGTYTFDVVVDDTETQSSGETLTLVISPASTPPPPVTTPVTTPVTATTGYDLVGSDGGVFVFDPPGQTGGFFGSLPTLGVTPSKPIVGMVPTVTDSGYFLVGSDGGVFAFGTAPFLGSLPGVGVTPNQPIVGIVAANTDKGYFLVGADGGVYAFGTASFAGSPAEYREEGDQRHRDLGDAVGLGVLGGPVDRDRHRLRYGHLVRYPADHICGGGHFRHGEWQGVLADHPEGWRVRPGRCQEGGDRHTAVPVSHPGRAGHRPGADRRNSGLLAPRG